MRRLRSRLDDRAVASAEDLPTKSGTVTCLARTATRMANPANTKNVTASAPVRSRILPKPQTRVRINVDNRAIVQRGEDSTKVQHEGSTRRFITRVHHAGS